MTYRCWRVVRRVGDPERWITVSGRAGVSDPGPTVLDVQLPVWVTVVVALLSAAGSYAGGVRSARIAAGAAAQDRELAEQERADSREKLRLERIDAAWELCRSDDERDKRAGVRQLRALLREPPLTRLVANILDEVAQEELGDDLQDLREAYRRTGELPDVDIVVREGDHGSDDGPAPGAGSA